MSRIAAIRDRTYDEMQELGNFDEPTLNLLARIAAEGRTAVRVAHGADLDAIAGLLAGGQSALVQCDKAITENLITALAENEQLPAVKLMTVTFNGAAPRPGESTVAHLLTNAVNLMKEAVSNPDAVVVIRHLDLLSCTADGRARSELNDILYWFSEFSSVTKLAFWDPMFPLPKVVEALFPNRLALQAFDRSVLWQLLRVSEARKLSSDSRKFTVADQSRLYQYISGTNVIELRRILRGLDSTDFPDFPPNKPQKAFEHIRAQIGMAPFVKSGAVVGYQSLQRRLRDEVVFPMNLRASAATETDLLRADALVPRGVILHGPPGTGKTEWAKWLASELNTPLFLIHGPELKHKHVGETEASIRRIFASARRAAPSMIVIDEIDAVTPARSDQASNFEASMVAQFLTEMDGIRREETVIVVGTTNRLEAVDVAFLRPGRFSILLEIGYPDLEDRLAILSYYNDDFGLGLNEASVRLVATDVAADRRHGRSLSGDHLRAICLSLLRESVLYGATPEALNDPAFLRERAAAFVQPNRAAASSNSPLWNAEKGRRPL